MVQGAKRAARKGRARHKAEIVYASCRVDMASDADSTSQPNFGALESNYNRRPGKARALRRGVCAYLLLVSSGYFGSLVACAQVHSPLTPDDTCNATLLSSDGAGRPCKSCKQVRAQSACAYDVQSACAWRSRPEHMHLVRKGIIVRRSLSAGEFAAGPTC